VIVSIFALIRGILRKIFRDSLVLRLV